MHKAIEFEISRQTRLWEEGKTPDADSTRGWIDETEETKLLRSKESADDYRYFPEPDLPPLVFTKDQIENFYANVPELPSDKFIKYRKEYKLADEYALKISSERKLSDFFDEAVKISGNPKKTAQLVFSVLLANEKWSKTHITPTHFVDVISLMESNTISSSGAKQIRNAAMEKENSSAKSLMMDLGLEQISNEDELGEWIDAVIGEHSSVVSDFKNGKEKAIGFLVGQVMKKSRGSANPELVQKSLIGKLKN